LNRFCVQAVAGHPLTVYGAGGQTRGMLNIRDTLACVELAVTNPAEESEYRVFNQFTESFSIKELADKVVDACSAPVKVTNLDNPRVEKEQHYYRAAHTKLLDLGLVPHFLDRSTVASILSVAERHRDRIDLEAIAPSANWRRASSDSRVHSEVSSHRS
jgi:UDP-sulfoquinovose synthase